MNTMSVNSQLLRQIPKVDDLLRLPQLSGLDCPHPVLTEAVRETIEQLRQQILAGETPSLDSESICSAFPLLRSSVRSQCCVFFPYSHEGTSTRVPCRAYSSRSSSVSLRQRSPHSTMSSGSPIQSRVARSSNTNTPSSG